MRYSILYFVLFVLFLGLVIGPAVIGTMDFMKGVTSKLNLPMNLVQPAHQNNNDTRGYTKTGVGLLNGQGTSVLGGDSIAQQTQGSGNNGGGGGGGGGGIPNGLSGLGG